MAVDRTEEAQQKVPAFGRTLGIRIVSYAPDKLVGEMPCGEPFRNRNGVLHGGAILGFSDALGGLAAAMNLQEDETTTTIESKVNFIRAVPMGGSVRGVCTPIHLGRRLTIWRIAVIRSDGKEAAIITQTQMTLPPENNPQ